MAIPSDKCYAVTITTEMEESAKIRGIGIAKRFPSYIEEKIEEGKAIIALTADGTWVGFCYIEAWENEKYIANSGLIVSPSFRQSGVAKEIKKMILDNPEEFSKLKKAERSIKKSHLALNILIKRLYADLPPAHKKKLSYLAKEWYKENQKVFSKANNPFRQYLQELDLLRDFFIKLGLIITKAGIISKE